MLLIVILQLHCVHLNQDKILHMVFCDNLYNYVNTSVSKTFRHLLTFDSQEKIPFPHLNYSFDNTCFITLACGKIESCISILLGSAHVLLTVV